MEYLVFCKRHTSTISKTNIEPRLLIPKITAGKVGRCHISRRHRLIWVYLPTGAVRSHSARAEFNFTVRPPGGASGARQQARSTPPGGGARNQRQIPATSFGHEYRQPVTSDPRFLETHRWLGLACQSADCQFFCCKTLFKQNMKPAHPSGVEKLVNQIRDLLLIPIETKRSSKCGI